MNTHKYDGDVEGVESLVAEELVDGVAAVVRHLERLGTGPVWRVLSVDQVQALRNARERDWRQDAVCASTDLELWFPDQGGTTIPAKTVCVGCPVRRSCLATALLLNESGIWGGTTDRQRLHAHRRFRAGLDAEMVLDHLLTTSTHLPRQSPGSDAPAAPSPARGSRWAGKARPDAGGEKGRAA